MTRPLILLLPLVALSALDLSQEDKQLHFAGGAIIGYVSADIADRCGAGPLGRFLIGTATGTAVGWLKEARDRQGHGTYDPHDAHATMIGSALGAGAQVGVSLVFTRNGSTAGYTVRF